MKGTSRELLTIWSTLILFYLAVEHYTGFSSDVNSIAKGAGGLTRTLQGR